MANSEKNNPASKQQTKNVLNAGVKRGGNPAYPDHAPSQKLVEQSAGLRRRGDNSYEPDYPDTTASTGVVSTGHNWSGTKKGTRQNGKKS